MMDAGRMKFLPFFYAFRHPIYQEVEYRDLANRAMYPDCIHDLVKLRSCYKTSELEMNHQGGDFCLENKIKRLKLIAPKGRITNGMWRMLCRGLDDIEEVYNNASESLSLGDGETYKDTDLYNEIVSWRSVLRLSEMLSGTEQENVIKNIFGEPLNSDLDDFTYHVEQKMEKYWEFAYNGVPLQSIQYTKINILQEALDESDESDFEDEY